MLVEYHEIKQSFTLMHKYTFHCEQRNLDLWVHAVFLQC